MMTRLHARFSWERHAARSILLAVLLAASCVKTEEEAPVITQTMAVNYLSQFGYLKPLNPTSGGILSEDSVTSAIADFQAFAGLNITGELDPETARQMTLPRCGVKDKVGPGSGRSKRFALQGSRWRVKKLTYKISKYPKNLSPRKVDEELRKAFQVWADYTDLSFTPKKSGQVHIEIRFETGEHGDGDPFDGPGGTLAHAYFPVYGGDAHFDDAEYWTIGSVRGTNLFQVAAHEFGHSLGLSHSDEKDALMAPFYRGYQPGFKLDEDDILAIQTLYGPKSASTQSYPGRRASTTPSTPSSEEDPTLCTDPKVDTMFNSAEGTTYVFKGDHYWRLTLDGVAAGYPKLISRSWQGLPGNIDAAFTYKNGKTYFFKGSKYWRYVGKRMDGDYPKEISEGFTGIPDNIDAVTVWTGNGNIYFYKGSKFWRFDPNQKPPVKNTYPKLISNWEGVPDNLDTALSYRGYTYFFKGNAYYRFQDRTFSVDTADPAFPRSIAYWWFGCRSANKGTLGNVQWLKESPESTFGDNGNLGFADGDFDNQYDRSDDVDDIILDAGETDEQMVTSSNQGSGSAAGGSAFESTAGNRLLTLALLTIIVARLVAAT